MPNRLLVQYFDEWEDFRLAELESLLKVLKVPHDKVTFGGYNDSKVFSFIEVPDLDVAKKLCERSILIKAIYEVWGTGASLEEAVEATRAVYSGGSNSNKIDESLFDAKNSWCVNIDVLYKKTSSKIKEDYRNHFKFLDFQGTVRLDDPDVHVQVVVDCRIEYDGKHTLPKDKEGNKNSSSSSCSGSNKQKEGGSGEGDTNHSAAAAAAAATAAAASRPVYCGRLIARGGMRATMQKYDLKTRLYLGPTTLDHFLSFIMANMAGVTAGDLCLDPFVGTASLLVPLAHHGAFCMGTDIDVRVIRGMMYAGSNRKEDAAVAKAQQQQTTQSDEADQVRRDVFSTFGDYSLPAPELLRLDLHSFAKHYHHSAHGMFDAIVTDPPYGIRAGGRKSGKASGVVYEISKERRHDHIPVTQNYGVEEVMLDLLDCSATLLKEGGALCYLIPTPFDFAPEDLPQHPCFDMEQLCLQQLSTRHGRHAVLLRKQRPYTEERKAEFGAYKQKVLAGEEGHFDLLAKKLEEALAPAARENETVVIRSSKKAAKRRQAADERRQRREEGAGGWKGEKGIV